MIMSELFCQFCVRVRNGGKEYRKNESLEGILYQSFIFKGKNKLIMKSRKRYASMWGSQGVFWKFIGENSIFIAEYVVEHHDSFFSWDFPSAGRIQR